MKKPCQSSAVKRNALRIAVRRRYEFCRPFAFLSKNSNLCNVNSRNTGKQTVNIAE